MYKITKQICLSVYVNLIEKYAKMCVDNAIAIIMYILRVFPIRKNKILFSSFNSQYSDNPRFIYEALMYDSGLEFVWVTNGHLKIPGNVRQVCHRSLQWLWELATARVWVDNSRKVLGVRKRKGQYYIQTWHGNIGIKKVENDAKDSLPVRYILQAENDSKMIDLFLSGSVWCTRLYRNAFWYRGKILEHSLPREDIFYSDQKSIVRRVRDFYHLSSDTQIAVYAPTFRADCSLDVYDLDYNRLLTNLKLKFKTDWVLLIRLHPHIADKEKLIHYSDVVLNGTKYPDMNELIVAARLLITDYSSCMFDAATAGKGVLLYASDKAVYEQDRGMYFSLSELPFPLAESNDQLEKNILQFNENVCIADGKAFLRRHGCYTSGGGAELVANHIRNVLKERNEKS